MARHKGVLTEKELAARNAREQAALDRDARGVKFNGDQKVVKRREAWRKGTNNGSVARFMVSKDYLAGPIPETIFEKADDRLPNDIANKHKLAFLRGEADDETSINYCCDLIARGVTPSKARDYVGVPSVTWGLWTWNNIHNINEKIKFAKRLFLERKGDEVFDIIDDPALLERERDEDGKPTGAAVSDKIALAKARCDQRRAILGVLAPEYAPKSATLSLTKSLDKDATPEEVAELYYSSLEGSPNTIVEK